MTTTVRRTFRSSPHRNTHDTWCAIVDLLTRGRDNSDRTELLSVSGIVASIIADRAPQNAAIITTCDGPRTRIYCLYDDEAIDGGDANEDSVGFNPLNGDWRVSLPCLIDDLAWVQEALKTHSERITARDSSETTVAEDDKSEVKSATLVIDPKGFLDS